MIRLGANLGLNPKDPEEWIAQARDLNCQAISSPIDDTASAEERRAYREAAKEHDILIAEVGVWNNPISPNLTERKAAVEKAVRQLELAEERGASCCVHIMGAAGAVWDGCYAENLTEDTYALSVDTVRQIIDAVNPKHTFYTIEPMPWMYPDSPDNYLKLIRDIDRPAFAVHMDYTNMINGLDKYFNSDDFIRECFQKLGPYIKSIHAKDIIAETQLPCSIREVLPGTGSINYRKVLKLADSLGREMPVLVEHLDTYEEYKTAVAHLHQVWETCR